MTSVILRDLIHLSTCATGCRATPTSVGLLLRGVRCTRAATVRDNVYVGVLPVPGCLTYPTVCRYPWSVTPSYAQAHPRRSMPPMPAFCRHPMLSTVCLCAGTTHGVMPCGYDKHGCPPLWCHIPVAMTITWWARCWSIRTSPRLCCLGGIRVDTPPLCGTSDGRCHVFQVCNSCHRKDGQHIYCGGLVMVCDHCRRNDMIVLRTDPTCAGPAAHSTRSRTSE